jgi:hypothetical protein
MPTIYADDEFEGVSITTTVPFLPAYIPISIILVPILLSIRYRHTVLLSFIALHLV